MVNALAVHFPLAGREELVYYHPSPVERYFPVAPGIEVSADPFTDFRRAEGRLETGLYNRQGKISVPSSKGEVLDTSL